MASNKKVGNHHHKWVIVFASSTLVLSILILAVTSIFASEKLKWRQEVNRHKCDTEGRAIIGIRQKITKSIDSGEAGNYWAFDNFDRNIRVWKLEGTGNEYCAVVSYRGTFDAVEGQRSPGNTGVLTGREDGRFNGGYRMLIIGTLKSHPDLPSKGFIGTTNYNCDISGNCPGAFDWTTKYFNTSVTGFSSTLEWWGWQYFSHKQKVWINSVDGNSGDVL